MADEQTMTPEERKAYETANFWKTLSQIAPVAGSAVGGIVGGLAGGTPALTGVGAPLAGLTVPAGIALGSAAGGALGGAAGMGIDAATGGLTEQAAAETAAREKPLLEADARRKAIDMLLARYNKYL